MQVLDACGEVASEIDRLGLDLDDRKPAPKPIMDKVNAILQGVIPLDDEVQTHSSSNFAFEGSAECNVLLQSLPESSFKGQSLQLFVKALSWKRHSINSLEKC